MWLLSAVLSLLTANLIFTRALGTSTMLAATKSRSNLILLALLMTVFSTLACLLTSSIFSISGLTMLLEYPYSLGLPLMYTAVISVIYLIVLLLLHILFRNQFSNYKKYVHLSAFNCAVMGTLYLAFAPIQPLETIPGETYVLESAYTFHPIGAMLFGLQEGIGFLLAALLVSAVRKRLYDGEVPAAFRGFPAVMVYIGLISMAIYAITIDR